VAAIAAAARPFGRTQGLGAVYTCGNVSVAFVACAVADMTVRSSRQRLRIRLQCGRSSNCPTFACVRRLTATAGSSPFAMALASSGSTTAPSPTSAYALCPRHLRRGAAKPPCMRASAELCVMVLCATLRFPWVAVAFRARNPHLRGSVTVLASPRQHPTCLSSRIGADGRSCELACGVQANGDGGLVSIFRGTGHVSVVGSTLTNIAVRANC
jgi:hypothetical protein